MFVYFSFFLQPPKHCEAGPLDNALDDSKLTAFGDDYRLCLDSAPLSARSDISESVCASPNIERLVEQFYVLVFLTVNVFRFI